MNLRPPGYEPAQPTSHLSRTLSPAARDLDVASSSSRRVPSRPATSRLHIWLHLPAFRTLLVIGLLGVPAHRYSRVFEVVAEALSYGYYAAHPQTEAVLRLVFDKELRGPRPGHGID